MVTVCERTVQGCSEIRWVRTERQKLAVGLNFVLTFGLSDLLKCRAAVAFLVKLS